MDNAFSYDMSWVSLRCLNRTKILCNFYRDYHQRKWVYVSCTLYIWNPLLSTCYDLDYADSFLSILMGLKMISDVTQFILSSFSTYP